MYNNTTPSYGMPQPSNMNPAYNNPTNTGSIGFEGLSYPSASAPPPPYYPSQFNQNMQTGGSVYPSVGNYPPLANNNSTIATQMQRYSSPPQQAYNQQTYYPPTQPANVVHPPSAYMSGTNSGQFQSYPVHVYQVCPKKQSKYKSYLKKLEGNSGHGSTYPSGVSNYPDAAGHKKAKKNKLVKYGVPAAAAGVGMIIGAKLF